MRVFVQSLLPCEAAAAWAEVQKSSLLFEVIYPLARVTPLPGEPLPERWQANETVRCRLHLFGVVPLGVRTLHFDRVDERAREIKTREFDPLVRRWDHLIQIRPAENGACWYSDEVEVEAGLLTPLVWLFATCLYQHRQRRWRRVARRLAAGPAATQG